MMSSDKGLLELFIGHTRGLLGEEHQAKFFKHVANNPQTTYTLMTKSPDFINLVNSKAHQSALTLALNASSKQTLNENNGFEDDVVSLDKSKLFSPFKSFLSLYLLNNVSADAEQPLTNHDKGKLNLACELGSYDALTIRCLINCKKIKENMGTEISSDFCIKEILIDLDHLANLYGFMGYIKAAQIHLLLNEIYHQADNVELALSHKMEAIKSFLCAELLYKNPKMHDESIKLMGIICKGSPLVITIDKHERRWEDLKPYLFDLISADDKESLEKRASVEVTSLITPSASAKSSSKLG